MRTGTNRVRFGCENVSVGVVVQCGNNGIHIRFHLFEIVEDLEDIDAFGSDTTAFEDIIIKWKARLEDAQDAAGRQYEMFDGMEA